MSSKSSQFIWAAEQTLRRFRRPMSAREIYSAAREAGLFSDAFQGKTPEQTMKSKLSTHIIRNGEMSIFVRTAPGRFYLREFTSNAEIYPAPRWTPPPSDEIVTVFPSGATGGKEAFQGLTLDYQSFYGELFESGICFGMPRTSAELTEEYKQVIAYVLVRRGDDFLAYRRGVYNRTADMLRGSDCVGFGGHVSEDDHNLFSVGDAGILEAAARELSEELKLPAEDIARLANREGLRIVGIINDDSTSVGRRHLAVVIEYVVSEDSSWDSPERGEESITKLRWVGPEREALNLDDFEYWSQLCLRALAPDLVRMQPSLRIRRKLPFRTPHLLCVVGQIGSGKTEVTQTLKKLGYASVNSGEVVARLIGQPKVKPSTRLAFQREAYDFITAPDGPKLLAEALSTYVDTLAAERVLIDGIRQPATLAHLRSLRGRQRVPLLYVAAAPDTAYGFYRARELRSASMKEFLMVRDAPVEQEIPLMLEDSDGVLYNWLGKDELIQAVRGLPFLE